MENTLQISPKETINAFLLFFVIHTNQVAVGIHGFQRIIFQDAKHDAWISVILAGLLTHIVAVIMLKTLEIYGTQDLYGIHLDLFGQWMGNFINALYVLYCSVAFFTILQNYIEVIQTWVFHDLNFKFIAASILLLVCYAFLGGIRVIVGVTFFSFIFAIWLFPMLGFPLQYTEFRDVFPFLENDFLAILKGVHSMTLTIVGFEILNIIYPYVKEKKKVSKFLHLGLLVTTLMYLSVMLVSLSFFSEGQLNKTIWATLSLFGVIKLPFIERTELIAVCYWLLVILPNLCLYLWAAHRGITRMVKISSSKFAWPFIITIFIGCILFESRTQINSFNTYFSQVAFYIVFVYPIFLFLIALLKKKYTAKRRNLNEEG